MHVLLLFLILVANFPFDVFSTTQGQSLPFWQSVQQFGTVKAVGPTGGVPIFSASLSVNALPGKVFVAADFSTLLGPGIISMTGNLVFSKKTVSNLLTLPIGLAGTNGQNFQQLAQVQYPPAVLLPNMTGTGGSGPPLLQAFPPLPQILFAYGTLGKSDSFPTDDTTIFLQAPAIEINFDFDTVVLNVAGRINATFQDSLLGATLVAFSI